MSTQLLKASVLSVIALISTEASADALLAQTRSGNFTFNGPGPVAVPIAPGVFQTPAFFNGANQRFLVLYTAECAVNAANHGTWLDLDILAVNLGTGAATPLAPTAGTADAFCTSNGTAAQDNWHTNAVNAVGGGNLPAGNYVIRIQGKIQGTTLNAQGWLGDSSITVWR